MPSKSGIPISAIPNQDTRACCPSQCRSLTRRCHLQFNQRPVLVHGRIYGDRLPRRQRARIDRKHWRSWDWNSRSPRPATGCRTGPYGPREPASREGSIRPGLPVQRRRQPYTIACDDPVQLDDPAGLSCIRRRICCRDIHSRSQFLPDHAPRPACWPCAGKVCARRPSGIWLHGCFHMA